MVECSGTPNKDNLVLNFAFAASKQLDILDSCRFCQKVFFCENQAIFSNYSEPFLPRLFFSKVQTLITNLVNYLDWRFLSGNRKKGCLSLMTCSCSRRWKSSLECNSVCPGKESHFVSLMQLLWYPHWSGPSRLWETMITLQIKH